MNSQGMLWKSRRSSRNQKIHPKSSTLKWDSTKQKISCQEIYWWVWTSAQAGWYQCKPEESSKSTFNYLSNWDLKSCKMKWMIKVSIWIRNLNMETRTCLVIVKCLEWKELSRICTFRAPMNSLSLLWEKATRWKFRGTISADVKNWYKMCHQAKKINKMWLKVLQKTIIVLLRKFCETSKFAKMMRPFRAWTRQSHICV